MNDIASSPKSTASVKGACDSCHRRKVKCVGEGTDPCKNCVSTCLACTYNAIPKKKGPKGSRVKVLSELRETQRNAQLAAGFSTDLGFDVSSIASTQCLLSPNFVHDCLAFFFIHIHPIEPALNYQRAQEAVSRMRCSKESYCMIATLCAYVMIETEHQPTGSFLYPCNMARMPNKDLSEILLEKSARVRESYHYREIPTHTSVIISWLYSRCYFKLALGNTALMYMREAITHGQLLGMHDEKTYEYDEEAYYCDRSRRSETRVLYWHLFIAERTLALCTRHFQPFLVQPDIRLPTEQELLQTEATGTYLVLMINMLKFIDTDLVSRLKQAHTIDVHPEWLFELHMQLSRVRESYRCCSEAQKAELDRLHRFLLDSISRFRIHN